MEATGDAISMLMTIFVCGFQALIALGVVGALVWVVVHQINKSNEEKFEKRKN
ncbi:hypothetical protein KC717_01790 [Candidatus Dojkabacteria bacterium]|uniref:Uncharacterized protein n=1 Tax=Candidatus Dojkabacteria bacterium TaxID=2099670 RepID=A0A955RK36_9BACT|nr:hypothetical protein [Candidatus Dojkabacteria bacterium]